MIYRHTLEAAVESLHEIEDLIKAFPEDGNIPAVEIDLALQKLRNLYELLLFMRGKETTPVSIPEKKPDIPSDNPEKGISETQSTSAVIVVEESKKTTVAVSSATEEKKPDTEEKAEIISGSKDERKERRNTSGKKTGVEVHTLADQFKGRTTLLETLSEAYNKENEMFAPAKPVTDLMSAIGVNDRFTLIRELFNNDKKIFETAIAALNEAGSFNNAYNYMMQQFNWDMDEETVQLLLSIVRRKYIKGKHE